MQNEIDNRRDPLSEELIAEILSEPDELKRTDMKQAARARAKAQGLAGAFDEKFKAVKQALADKPKKEKSVLPIVEAARRLREDPRLQAIVFNELTQTRWVRGCLPWQTRGSNDREWTNNDGNNLRLMFAGQNVMVSASDLEADLDVVSRERAFNPITERLEAIEGRWDGREHIADLIPDYLGGRKTTVTTEAMKLVMLGAISRAYHPGCKFDVTLILVGPQGCGKSTFIRLLAIDDGWFTDVPIDLNSEKPAEVILGKWFCEFSELLSMRRAREVEGIKAFLTRTSDRMRRPYERAAEEFPRTCVFIGSTNSRDFLNDKSGNRRYLPVEVGVVPASRSLFNREQVQKDIEQAWAEAMHIYRSGAYSLTIPENILDDVEAARGRFMEQDPVQEKIEEYLDQHPYTDKVCSKLLFYTALGHYPQDRFEKVDAKAINRIMDSLPGWKKTEKKARFRIGDEWTICYGYQRDTVSSVAENDGQEWLQTELEPLPFGE